MCINLIQKVCQPGHFLVVHVGYHTKQLFEYELKSNFKFNCTSESELKFSLKLKDAFEYESKSNWLG